MYINTLTFPLAVSPDHYPPPYTRVMPTQSPTPFLAACVNCGRSIHGTLPHGHTTLLLNFIIESKLVKSGDYTTMLPENVAANSLFKLCAWCTAAVSGATALGWAANAPVAAMGRPCYTQVGVNAREMMAPFQVESHSFSASPGSATDLSPSGFSEPTGYFDFVPAQHSASHHIHHHNGNCAPISPALSGLSSDNDPQVDPNGETIYFGFALISFEY